MNTSENNNKINQICKAFQGALEKKKIPDYISIYALNHLLCSIISRTEKEYSDCFFEESKIYTDKLRSLLTPHNQEKEDIDE